VRQQQQQRQARAKAKARRMAGILLQMTGGLKTEAVAGKDGEEGEEKMKMEMEERERYTHALRNGKTFGCR
jgi:hypothetical protein